VSQTAATIRPLGRPGDLGWVVMAHGELYASEFGWDTSFEALVARIVADYAAGPDPGSDCAAGPEPGPEGAWIAELDGRRVGCVFCVAGDETGDCKLRILLVDPVARGHALGSRLVATAVSFARDAGYRRMQLWTNDPLVAARRVYLRLGFTLTDERPHHSFGVDLVGQTYELDLREPDRATSGAAKGRAQAGQNS
jgi:GNAT superfamily N-acetyltransferase